MCGCDKKVKNKTYVPQYRQVLSKDRLGRVVILKVPIPPKRRVFKKKMIPSVPDIQPKLIENEIDAVLP